MTTKKTVPAKKTALKEFKAGARVKYTNRNGEVIKGTVKSVKHTLTGPVYTVEASVPKIVNVRPGQLKGF